MLACSKVHTSYSPSEENMTIYPPLIPELKIYIRTPSAFHLLKGERSGRNFKFNKTHLLALCLDLAPGK